VEGEANYMLAPVVFGVDAKMNLIFALGVWLGLKFSSIYLIDVILLTMLSLGSFFCCCGFWYLNPFGSWCFLCCWWCVDLPGFRSW